MKKKIKPREKATHGFIVFFKEGTPVKERYKLMKLVLDNKYVKAISGRIAIY